MFIWQLFKKTDYGDIIDNITVRYVNPDWIEV
ncbi:hypothetical protein G3A_14930 [Bacillus sp. 17376]|nr:hypothetical protein G3A_14930 [Bacillus sp. 17376]